MGTKKTSVPTGDPLVLFERLGVTIDPETLRLALTHRSYAYENGGIADNERLEFLGDSVLGISVTDYLYRTYPDSPEGQLAKLRSAVVSTRALATLARTLDLGDYIYLGQGEVQTGGNDKASILADTTEAVIGAAYLTHGIEVAQQMVLRLLIPFIKDAARMGTGTDWKTSIQEAATQFKMGSVRYTVTGAGPDHDRTFEAVLAINGVVYGSGNGRSKKEAEQEAAQQAYRHIQETLVAPVEEVDA